LIESVKQRSVQSVNNHYLQVAHYNRRSQSVASISSSGSSNDSFWTRKKSSSNEICQKEKEEAEGNSLKLSARQLDELTKNSGLDEESLEDKYLQFVELCDKKPIKGLNERQFMKLYKKAYPHALNPTKLANSIFRLCDQNNDNVIDFKEFISSFCIPPSRYVHMYSIKSSQSKIR